MHYIKGYAGEVMFENVPFSNPNWCRELHQFEPLATFFARDMRLKYGNKHGYANKKIKDT